MTTLKLEKYIFMTDNFKCYKLCSCNKKCSNNVALGQMSNEPLITNKPKATILCVFAISQDQNV